MVISTPVLFALNRMGSLSSAEKIRILSGFGTPGEFGRLTLFELEWLLGRKLRLRRFVSGDLLRQGEADLLAAEKAGIRWTWIGSSDYPALLREIYDPPFLLFRKGTLPPADRGALAVVGTRRPSLEADRAAYSLGMDAARGGIPHISGMAAGIDGASHSGVLTLKGRTWAVLGTGCDRPYPGTHRRLAADIVNSGGGLLSEFPPGTGPARYNFPRRNRIISGLSTRVVIVQAPRRSGALYTADFALDQGRDVAVHESGLSGRCGRGTAALAEQGARVIRTLWDLCPELEESARTLRDSWGLSEGSHEEAGQMCARLMREELRGTAVFYKGRVQTNAAG